MKYWSSGEVESSVGEGFRIAMNSIEYKINLLISKKDYSTNIDNIDVIYIIRRDGGKDNIVYKPKSKELDLKVTIDYELFLYAVSVEQEQIMINGLIRVIKSMLAFKKTKDINFIEFCSDLKQLI